MSKFETGDAVFVDDDEIQGEATVIEESTDLPGRYFVHVPGLGGGEDAVFMVREDCMSPIVEAEEDREVLTAPPFGLDAEQFTGYMESLLDILLARVDELDTSEVRGYQTFEAADLSDVLTATLKEVEDAILGTVMVHLRVTRMLDALDEKGIS